MKLFKNYVLPTLALGLMLGATSCKKDDDDDMTDNTPDTPTEMKSETYDYNFNNGQLVSSSSYAGSHMDNLMASMTVEETGDNSSKITVTLENTVDGEMYMIHAHDAADPNTTPNGTPYNETPNSAVFTQMATGNGGDVSISQTVDMSFDDITASYEGFFVVHDPLQPISTTDLTTYLVLGTFAREQAAYTLTSEMFNYDFNTGQIAASFAYAGSHASNLGASIKLQELGDGSTRVSVMLNNSIDGEMYMIHSHDVADPNLTPNGTPYDETPNSDVCTMMATGNGASVSVSQMSSMSIGDLTTSYEGFFVVHDPLQAITTTDPTTYVILGEFAR